jgi:putative MATE family efflux protein
LASQRQILTGCGTLAAVAPSPDPASTAVAQPAALTLTAFLSFLGPLMLSNVLQALSGTINNVYLGQLIGVHALAAVTAFFPIQFFFVAFVIGVGGGAAVVIGQAVGAGHTERVKAVLGTALTATIAVGLLIAIGGVFLARDMVAAIGTPPDILADTTAYARIMFIALPCMFLFLMFTSMLNGVGDSVTPAVALTIATVIGLVATPALILGWGGLPPQGIISGAYATLFSFLVTLILLAAYLRWRGHPLAPDAKLLRAMRIDWRILGHVLHIGIPTGVQLVIVSLTELAVISFVNRFGSDATAAYGAVNQVASYVQFPTASIAIASSIFAAQALGGGHVDRLGSVVRIGVLLNLVLTGAFVAFAYVFSRSLLSFFITSPEVVDLAQSLLQITLWSYIVLGIAAVFISVMEASGTVLVPTLISILAIVFVEVPVAWWLSNRIGINGIWYAYPIAFVTMLVLQAGFFRFGWKHREPVRGAA